jgi:hypothetical protein
MLTLARIILAAALLALAAPAHAQQPVVTGTPGVFGEAHVQQAPTPIAAPPLVAGPGQVVTVRDGKTTVSGGSLIGEVILWASLLLGAPLAGLAVALILKLLRKFGVEVSDADRARLKEFVENGVALAAQRANAELSGKLQVEVKNEIAAQALAYVQEHGADTLKKLGYDENDPKAIEALQARIAKLLADKAATVANVSVSS